MSVPAVQRNWFKPTRRRVVLFAAFIGLLMLMSAEPEPIIRYNGGGETVSSGGVDNPIFRQMSAQEAAEYTRDLKTRLQEAKIPVVGDLKSHLTQQQNERSGVMLRIMWAFSLFGLFMLGAPLILGWRYPLRRFPTLVWYSIISAGLFMLVGSILVGLYALTRYTSGLVSTAYNPQLSITESLFDFLISRADSLTEIGPTVIEPTVDAMQQGPNSPALQLIFENAESFSETLKVFFVLARLAQIANEFYALFPLALLLLAFFLFIRNALPTMKEIIRLPGRAASGHEQAARATIRTTVNNIRRETIYALALIAVLLVLTVVVATLGRGAIEPALEIVLNYVIAAMIYAQTEAGAQPGLILFCTTVALLFLVMVLMISTLAAVLFLWRASYVLRTVTRSGVSIKSERQFWLRGTGGLAWAMLVPVIYALAASPAIALWGQSAVDNRTWGVMFGLIPIALVGGFFVAFWAGNGFKSLMFVRRYQPQAVTATEAGVIAVATEEMASDPEPGPDSGEEVFKAGAGPDELPDTEGFDLSA